MRKVLASLKPYYYYLVGEGIKKIEFRKDMPKASDWNKEVLFYMSKDVKSFAKIPKELQEKYRKHFGKVGLKFICDKVEKLEEHIEERGLYYILNSDFNEAAQLDNWQLHDYGKGKPLYGWHISDLKIYDKPKELREFKKPCYYKSAFCLGEKCEYWGYSGCENYLTRPFQSWGYVEEL